MAEKAKQLTYVTFTCEACGSQQYFEKPNTLFDEGECSVCGHVTPITEYGLVVEFPVAEPKPRAVYPMYG